MRFAFINNNRVEAQPKLKGLCSCCSKSVIAKCGTQKIWHWSHKSKTACDNWWEPETEWHRTWKSNYPTEWQEISLVDRCTGEKHIADVRTSHNLVLEFQYSHIDSQERTSREKFYKNMVWVVDGTRLKRDYPRFLKGRKNSFENQIFYNTDKPNIFRVDLIDWCLPSAWLESSVPVIFDFLVDDLLENDDGLRTPLYCLFPQVGQFARIAELSRNAFIKTTTNGEWTSRVKSFIESFKKEDSIKIQEQQQIRPSTVFPRQFGTPLNRVIYTKKRRRF